MLCLSFYEWRCIYPGEQMILAPFLEKTSLDRAPGRFADNLFVRKHEKADVLLTTVMGLLRGGRSQCRASAGLARADLIVGRLRDARVRSLLAVGELDDEHLGSHGSQVLARKLADLDHQ